VIQHKKLLAMLALESQPLVEATAVCCHQVNPFGGGYSRIGQQRFNNSAPKAMALVLGCHHHIPQNRSKNAIAGSPAEANELTGLPGTHNSAASQQHAHQGPAAATLGPKAVGVEKGLNLSDSEQQEQG